MCQVLGVSISGYYYWLKHQIGAKARKEQELLSQIKQVCRKSNGRYGSPRITVELKEQGVVTSRPRVVRLMKNRYQAYHQAEIPGTNDRFQP
jgi:putative transposase